MSKNSGVSEQVISLPEGGGSIDGIGETFSADPHTGTGSVSVPIDLPAGRNDFNPELSLDYNTGNGNGPFGQGWELSIPGVSRKTSDGVPRYDDGDTFVLSGKEDLVAVETSADSTATVYRPRTEGVFARIVRHHDADNNYWRVHSTDGRTSTYGTPGARGADPAVVADPAVRTDVFAWRLTRTEDTHGNEIVYEYDRDARETDDRRWDQTYLGRIEYVDVDSNGSDASDSKRLVSVEFDYGRESDESLSSRGRPDPFSDYSAGFEIRTRKRCTGITVASHVDDDGEYDVEGRTIRRYDLIYRDELPNRTAPLNGASLLNAIEVTGRNGEGETAETQRLPPLEFGYTVEARDPSIA